MSAKAQHRVEGRRENPVHPAITRSPSSPRRQNTGLIHQACPIQTLSCGAQFGLQTKPRSTERSSSFAPWVDAGTHCHAPLLRFRRELLTAMAAYRQWVGIGAPGNLFVSLSASGVTEYVKRHGIFGIHDLLKGHLFSAGRVFVTLWDYGHLASFAYLAAIKEALRANGIGMALGVPEKNRHALLAWNDIQPDFAWIEDSCAKDAAAHPHKRVTVQSLAQFGKSLHIQLIARGIDTPEQARALQALGIDLGQGSWLITPPDGKATP